MELTTLYATGLPGPRRRGALSLACGWHWRMPFCFRLKPVKPTAQPHGAARSEVFPLRAESSLSTQTPMSRSARALRLPGLSAETPTLDCPAPTALKGWGSERLGWQRRSPGEPATSGGWEDH